MACSLFFSVASVFSNDNYSSAVVIFNCRPTPPPPIYSIAPGARSNLDSGAAARAVQCRRIAVSHQTQQSTWCPDHGSGGGGSTLLVEADLGVFVRFQAEGQILRQERGRQEAPLHLQGGAHRRLPAGPGQGQGRRLDGTLDEHTAARPPLGRAGDLAPAPEEIGLRRPGKTMAWNFFLTRSSQGRRHVEAGEGGANPLVQAPVTFRRAEAAPFVLRRKYQAVSPVGVVGHQAAAGGAAT